MNRTIKIRRGLDRDRLNSIFRNGEPFFATDTRTFYLGDGISYGGIALGGTTIFTGIMGLTGHQSITGNKNFDSIASDKLLDGNGIGPMFLASGNQYFIDNDALPSVSLYNYILTGSPDGDTTKLDWSQGIFNNRYSSSHNITLNFNNSLLSGNWNITNNTPPNNFNSNGNIGIISISGNSLCFCTGLNEWGKLNLTSF